MKETDGYNGCNQGLGEVVRDGFLSEGLMEI